MRLKLFLFLLLCPVSVLATPATPTDAPRAHPLAPNPHTSIGLFWWFQDPATGRQATIYTYKVKRCAGAGCTPTTVIASGLTNADYQDTGLASNTTFGYRYLANDGTDGGDSPTVYVTTLAADSTNVQFPDTTWANILGPQVEAAQIPFAYYNTNATTNGQTVISKLPFVVPFTLQGTGSVSNGSATLTGTGTFFLEQTALNSAASCANHIALDGGTKGITTATNASPIVITTSSAHGWATGAVITVSGAQGNTAANGSWTITVLSTTSFSLNGSTGNGAYTGNGVATYYVDLGTISSINSNTSITLTSAVSQGSQSGLTLSTNVSLCGFADPYNDLFVGNQLYYYDSPYALWQLYFRTGDPQYMRGAIKASESVFAGFIHLGRNREVDNLPAPRNFQFSGLLVLGMAGNSGVWDWLDHYLTQRYPTWVSVMRDGRPDFGFMRERAYMLTFASQYIMASPDAFLRSDGSTRSINGLAVDNSLATGRKGHWRDELNTDIPGYINDRQLAFGIWLESNAGASYPESDMTPFSVASTFQPFIGGLMGDALGFCWRNTALSTTTRNAARKEVLKLAAALGHLSYNTNIEPDDTAKRMRTVWYFLYRGDRLHDGAFQYGSDSAILNNTPDADMIAQYRQSIPLMLMTFGWAWEMSGQQWYKDTGDEMANAAFAAVGENSIGSGADGVKSLCHSVANFKDYGQCYRAAARYFGERLTTPSSLGTAPVVTMPGDVILTGGVNQASLTASVACTNTPCTYKWSLKEYPMVLPRDTAMPVFFPDDALTTKLCGLEAGTYKLIFYSLDALGLEGHGTVNVTVGDGVFPPVVDIGYRQTTNIPAIERHQFLTTSSTQDVVVRAYSTAGRTLSHSFTGQAPKDKSAPTITPSTATGNIVTVTVSGLSAGLWIITDTVTDSAGAVRKGQIYIRHTAEDQPSSGHNTIPNVAVPPNQVLPAGSSSTRIYIVPLDPEGIIGYPNPATGYTLGYNSDRYLVTALTHAWTQTAGPVTATITNATTQTADISGMTAAGTYTFHYAGTDQQGDVTTANINVVVSGTGIVTCSWSAALRCQ